MQAEYFRFLYDYTCWARDRVVQAATRLNESDYLAPRGLDHGSIHSTLFHTFASEALWRQRWMGRQDARLMGDEVASSLERLRELWTLEEAKIRAFVDGLTDADLEQTIEYTSMSGARQVEPLWQHLTQIVVHGAQHRSEIALALTQLGQSPGFLDFIAYTREERAKT